MVRRLRSPPGNYQDGYTVYLDKATVDAAYAGVPGGFCPAGSTNANWSGPFQHNSPAKPATCPTATAANVTVTSKKVDKKQVQIVLTNSGNADAILTEIQLSWPQAISGNLQQIKLDGDMVFDAGPAGIVGPWVDLKVPPLTPIRTSARSTGLRATR